MVELEYDWKHYLDFSLNLLEIEDLDEQTKYRVAVSRAYYAAFHFAENFLNKNNAMIFPYGTTHDKVCRSLIEINKGSANFKKSCHSVGNLLDTLRIARQNADYESVGTYTLKGARRQCIKAQKIIEELKKIS